MQGRKLRNPDIVGISHQIIESEIGGHLALAYSNISVLKQFYREYISREMQYHQGSVLFLTFYESPKQVKRNLVDAQIDILKYEGNGSLKIFDAIGILFSTYPYQLNPAPIKAILNSLQAVAKNNGVTLLIDTSPFYHLGIIEELIRFEELFAFDFFRHNWKSICLYCQSNLDCISIQKRRALAKCHDYVLRS